MKIQIQKMYNLWSVLFAIVLLGVVYLTALRPWMNRWGVTNDEMNISLPGDGTVNGYVLTSTRAITIQAPASEVWKWLVQVGQDRAGFYSNDWLENLAYSDMHNADEIRPDWQHRQQGDHVLGAGGKVYGQIQFWPLPFYEEGKAIYLWGPIAVLPVDAETSRLYARTFAAPASGLSYYVSAFSYDWMHFVMERGMLLGIKAHAEGTLNSNPIPRALSAIGWIVSTGAMTLILFARRRDWWWGLLPLAYAISIIYFTKDVWSAMAGFLWWGVIAAGFVSYGREWWKGLSLATALVVLTFVLAPQPHIAFGIIFLVITLAFAGTRVRYPKWAFSGFSARTNQS